MVHALADEAPRILQGQRRARPDALAFQRFVPVFDFPVRLWVIRLGSHVRHARDADEFLEVLGDELRPVVGDPPAAPRDASPWPLRE